MTSVPAVRAALVSLFTTALAAYEVQVVKAPGTVTTLMPTNLILGRVTGQRSAGSQNRIRTTTRNIPFGTSQDEYTVELFLSMSGGLMDIAELEAQIDVIFEAARTAVEDYDESGINGVFEILPTGEFEYEIGADANGHYVTIAWGVDVTARD
jgi:hypothetical protein